MPTKKRTTSSTTKPIAKALSKPATLARIANGTARAVIDKVMPEIDGGIYPIKRVVGESITVTADVFADGHDAIVVTLRYRNKGDKHWNESPMTFLGNDRWQGEFVTSRVGEMEYAVAAHVDHFLTWQIGFKKRVESGQDAPSLKTEVLIGAEILSDIAKRGSAEDARKIKAVQASLKKHAGKPEAISEALSETLLTLAQKYPDDALITQSRIYRVTVDPLKAGFSTWIEIFPRSWSQTPYKHGTFKDCERLLPDFADMGFDVLYLPPIHPIGFTKRKGKNNSTTAQAGDVGSPWAIGAKEGGHKAIHPELGTLKDFQRFVKTAKSYGIDIALDIAFQCSPDHPYVKEHPEWFKWRPDGTVQYAENPPKKYEDVLPFNFETEDWKNLWFELKSVFEFWIEHGVTIFRVDNPHTKPFAFWEWCLAELKRDYPDTIFLSEAFTRPKVMYRLAKLGYTHSYTYFTWRNNKRDLHAYLTELTTTSVKEYFRPNFWANTPDILSEEFLHNAPPSAFMLRYALAATLSSNIGIYEPAFSLCINKPLTKGKEEYLDSEKYEIKAWDLSQFNIRPFIKRINEIRKENPALQQTKSIVFTEVEIAPKVESEYLIAYLKSSGRNHVLSVVNHHPTQTQEGWVRVPLERLGIQEGDSYRVRELITNTEFTWNKAWNYLRLNPNELVAAIFRIEPE
ncbi:MAG: alpha-1,4-glucan--maltose-1-phosphate maltosyltransferase [Chloroherpetonaceae bacterium]